MSSLSTRDLARASARHPKIVVLVWVIAVAISAVIISQLLAGGLTTQAEFTNNPESKRADKVIRERFASAGAIEATRREPNETIIVRSATLTVDDPVFKAYVESLHSDLLALGPQYVEGSFNYLSGAPGLVSANRKTTILPTILRRPTDSIVKVDEVITKHADPNFEIYSVSNARVAREFNTMAEEDLSAEFRIGLPTALIVLLFVFGALVAALVPVVIAFMSMAIAVAAVALIGQAFPFSFFVTNMIAMMGLAVGIDYSLFILARYREERRKGLDKVAAIAAAGGTASRAVFFSGMTVVLALLGMLIVPTTIFRSLGAGAILVVLIAVAAALTLLPAIISLLGDKLDALRLPLVGRKSSNAESRGGFWDKTARAVMARPWISLIFAGGLLIAAAVPTLGMKTGQSGLSSMPEDTPTRVAFAILQADFNVGLNTNADVAITGPISSPEVQAAISKLSVALAADSAFYADRAKQRVNPAGDVAHISVPLVGDPSTQGPQDAVRRLRTEYIPAAFDGVAAQALVTGGVAGNMDFFQITNDYTPIVFAFVLTLSFLLLMVVFRSLVVPLKAIVLNMLSVGAAYGLLVLVFQHGVGASLLGFSRAPMIEAWIPLFLFSVLFGLSMDYHVFLLSRIREHFDRNGSNDDAISFGLRTTAGIITGAALIMVAIFSGFASGQLVMFQQVGFGLGVAVLLDATIVRSVLVPASMKLLGRRNWYLPKWLNWLPEIRTEAEEETQQTKVPVR